jgi:hypothetical protein
MNVRKEKRQGMGCVHYFRKFFVNYVVPLSHRFSSFMSENNGLVLKMYEIESMITLLRRKGKTYKKFQDAFGTLRLSLDFPSCYWAPIILSPTSRLLRKY